jgi:MYXO-CTERM domain-containing protein
MRAKNLAWLLAGLAMAHGVPSQAALIQGPGMVVASTDLPTCGAFCGFVGSDIRQISDGDASNFNGWAGANGLTGTIHLDLLGEYRIESFSLWNDINVLREGVGDFRLHFFDAGDALITSSAVFTAPVSQFAAGVYDFVDVDHVSRVDLEVLSLLTGGVCCRIEIRELAFNGQAMPPTSTVPEPGTLALGGLGLLAAWRRRRRADR